MTGKEKPQGVDMDSLRFVSLVSMFTSSAYQCMGKLADPATGEASRNLDAAQGFIDTLIMIRNKTRGNLSEPEDRLLESAIGDLQLNFVREKARPEPGPAETSKGEEKKESGSGDESGNDPAPGSEEKPG